MDGWMDDYWQNVKCFLVEDIHPRVAAVLNLLGAQSSQQLYTNSSFSVLNLITLNLTEGQSTTDMFTNRKGQESK